MEKRYRIISNCVWYTCRSISRVFEYYLNIVRASTRIQKILGCVCECGYWISLIPLTSCSRLPLTASIDSVSDLDNSVEVVRFLQDSGVIIRLQRVYEILIVNVVDTATCEGFITWISESHFNKDAALWWDNSVVWICLLIDFSNDPVIIECDVIYLNWLRWWAWISKRPSELGFLHWAVKRGTSDFDCPITRRIGTIRIHLNSCSEVNRAVISYAIDLAIKGGNLLVNVEISTDEIVCETIWI